MERGLMERGLMERGLMERGLMERGLMERGLMERGLMERGLMPTARRSVEEGWVGGRRFGGSSNWTGRDLKKSRMQVA
jgi:hypothetical protein